MSSKIFSIYDVSLLILALQCLVLASHFWGNKNAGSKLSSALFTCFSIFLLNLLVFWSEGLNHVYLYLFLLIFGFALGPLTYLLARQHIDAEFHLERRHALHFIPVFIYPLYLLLLYFSMDSSLYAAAQNFKVLWYDPLHVALMMAMLAILVSYSILSCKMVFGTLVAFEPTKEKTEGEDQKFLIVLIDRVLADSLLILTVGFSIYWIWNVLAFVLSLIAAGEAVVSVAGSIGNIALFALLSRINLQRAALQRSDDEMDEENKEMEPGKDPYRAEQVERIVAAMEEKQLYLNPELTLEQLAEHAKIQPRLVSTIINRRFNKNFFEFTNSYRVNHAKNLLRTSDKGVSMLDIMADSGFNSKSAFNRFFKKYTEMTPTQYRQAHKKQ